jgi:hypothetical protein
LTATADAWGINTGALSLTSCTARMPSSRKPDTHSLVGSMPEMASRYSDCTS